jgi:hypothetical protein
MSNHQGTENLNAGGSRKSLVLLALRVLILPRVPNLAKLLKFKMFQRWK